jgi:tripartite-type tricarboxylate transporter receptor subunit TctC
MKTSAAVALLALAIAQPCWAQNFPSKPITIVVPFGPGGNPDIITRALQPKMSEVLGIPIVIENRAGAGGNIGIGNVAKAPPDGYTIGLGTVNTLSMNQWIYKSMSFDPASLTPVALLGSSPNVLMVNPAVGVKSVAELVKLANAKPGHLTYASPGVGTSLHFSGELFKSQARVFITHIPYKSGPDAFADVVSGRVDMTFENILTAGRVAQDGKLTPLAVTSLKRSPLLPSIPTLDESGLTGFEVTAWVGLVAPPGTPRAIVERLNAAANAALREPAVVARLLALGFTPAGGTPAQFASHIAKESAKWGQVTKSAGIRAE